MENILYEGQMLLHVQCVGEILIKSCDICQRTKFKLLKNRHYHPRKPVDDSPMDILSVDIRSMQNGFNGVC